MIREFAMQRISLAKVAVITLAAYLSLDEKNDHAIPDSADRRLTNTRALSTLAELLGYQEVIHGISGFRRRNPGYHEGRRHLEDLLI
jgi:hypothetical protein